MGTSNLVNHLGGEEGESGGVVSGLVIGKQGVQPCLLSKSCREGWFICSKLFWEHKRMHFFLNFVVFQVYKTWAKFNTVCCYESKTS